jgi:hypothetical protein
MFHCFEELSEKISVCPDESYDDKGFDQANKIMKLPGRPIQ